MKWLRMYYIKQDHKKNLRKNKPIFSPIWDLTDNVQIYVNRRT